MCVCVRVCFCIITRNVYFSFIQSCVTKFCEKKGLKMLIFQENV